MKKDIGGIFLPSNALWNQQVNLQHLWVQFSQSEMDFELQRVQKLLSLILNLPSMLRRSRSFKKTVPLLPASPAGLPVSSVTGTAHAAAAAPVNGGASPQYKATTCPSII